MRSNGESGALPGSILIQEALWFADWSSRRQRDERGGFAGLGAAAVPCALVWMRVSIVWTGCLTQTIRAFEAQSTIQMIPCAREDEGVAIAVGLNLGGRTAICLMEASGIGYSGLILARAHVQRTPVVIVASHSGGGGEPFDYHGATTLVAERMFAGLGLSYEVATEGPQPETTLYRVIRTAQGQLAIYALLLATIRHGRRQGVNRDQAISVVAELRGDAAVVMGPGASCGLLYRRPMRRRPFTTWTWAMPRR